MKVISLIVFTFLLISCGTVSGTLKIDGIIYRTGFYREHTVFQGFCQFTIHFLYIFYDKSNLILYYIMNYRKHNI
jgi:hypothetical protein